MEVLAPVWAWQSLGVGFWQCRMARGQRLSVVLLFRNSNAATVGDLRTPEEPLGNSSSFAAVKSWGWINCCFHTSSFPACQSWLSIPSQFPSPHTPSSWYRVSSVGCLAGWETWVLAVVSWPLRRQFIVDCVVAATAFTPLFLEIYSSLSSLARSQFLPFALSESFCCLVETDCLDNGRPEFDRLVVSCREWR